MMSFLTLKLLTLATVVLGAPSNKDGYGGTDCCMALIPSCLACAAGQTEREYCMKRPMEMGCPEILKKTTQAATKTTIAPATCPPAPPCANPGDCRWTMSQDKNGCRDGCGERICPTLATKTKSTIAPVTCPQVPGCPNPGDCRWTMSQDKNGCTDGCGERICPTLATKKTTQSQTQAPTTTPSPPTTTWKPRVCCMAMTPECRACASGMTAAQYCIKYPSEMGCAAFVPDCSLVKCVAPPDSCADGTELVSQMYPQPFQNKDAGECCSTCHKDTPRCESKGHAFNPTAGMCMPVSCDAANACDKGETCVDLSNTMACRALFCPLFSCKATVEPTAPTDPCLTAKCTRKFVDTGRDCTKGYVYVKEGDCCEDCHAEMQCTIKPVCSLPMCAPPQPGCRFTLPATKNACGCMTNCGNKPECTLPTIGPLPPTKPSTGTDCAPEDAATCSEEEECVPSIKQCFTTPCPQFVCKAKAAGPVPGPVPGSTCLEEEASANCPMARCAAPEQEGCTLSNQLRWTSAGTCCPEMCVFVDCDGDVKSTTGTSRTTGSTAAPTTTADSATKVVGGVDTTGGAQTRLPTKPADDVTSLPTSTSAQDEALSAAADASAQDEALSAAAEASAQAEAEADKKHSAAATTTIVVLVVLLVLAVGVAMAISMRRATAGNSPIAHALNKARQDGVTNPTYEVMEQGGTQYEVPMQEPTNGLHSEA